MPFIDYNEVPELEIWPGFVGRLAHSGQLTFGEVHIDEGAVLPEHHHPHEQFTRVIEGIIEFTVSGETKMLTPGMVAHMPPNAPHSARAITKVIVFDTFCPVREDLKEKTEHLRG